MVSVWVEGVEELDHIAVQLQRKSKRVGAEAAAALRATALFVEANAKAIAPVDTGNLKSEIGPPEFKGDGRFGEASAEITSHADYSIYVEYGTRNMAPQAFMGPSADRAGPMMTASALAFSDPFDGGER